MKKTLLLFILSFSFSFSQSIKYPNTEKKIIDNIELNKVKETEIGEKLAEKGEILIGKAIRIDSIPETKSFQNSHLKVGDILPLQVIYQGYENYSVLEFTDKITGRGQLQEQYGVSVNLKTGKAYLFKSNLTEGFHRTITKETIKYTVTSTEVKCNDCFKKELVYNGKSSNNTLKFIYREYINDMARPAFNQELEYDLNESNIIGFKGIRIEIIKATNTNIEYKVLVPFN